MDDIQSETNLEIQPEVSPMPSTNTRSSHLHSISVVTISSEVDAEPEEKKPTSRGSSSRKRSLRKYLTREVLPHIDNYRNRMSVIAGMYHN